MWTKLLDNKLKDFAISETNIISVSGIYKKFLKSRRKNSNPNIKMGKVYNKQLTEKEYQKTNTHGRHDQ